MIRRRKHNIVDIRRSCITGKVVWVYEGASQGAAWTAYSKACRQEEEYIRRWPERAATRKANVLKLLSDLMEGLPDPEHLTPRQEEAARRLVAISKETAPCYRGFYEHVVEQKKRRSEDREIRRQMRERENRHNGNYDK